MTGFAKANTRIGYTQVEPNHMSGMVTGQILAQLPVDITTMGSVIEQGRFAKYDYSTGKVNLTGKGEWMMIDKLGKTMQDSVERYEKTTSMYEHFSHRGSRHGVKTSK